MKRFRVLVTRRWPAAVEARLSETFDTVLNTKDKPLSEEELRDALKSYDAILPTVTDKISHKVLDVDKPRAGILGNYGVGYSNIDIQKAAERGLVVTNTPDVLSECTADIAMTLLLMVARRAGEGERELRSGQWSGWRPTHLIGSKVSGKTLGIVGFGRIGQEMARRAHLGFGMKILVQDRLKVSPETLSRFNATQVDSLEELAPQCDFISLHCPGGSENWRLINTRILNLMKKDSFIINTARGEVVDEKALSRALICEQIGGAGLDVFEYEPIIHPTLMECENLVMLPHLGSATRETREAMGFRVFENLIDFFEGRPPRDQVN